MGTPRICNFYFVAAFC